MIRRRVFPFDLIARVLSERLRGCEPSEELRRTINSPAIDWEHAVAYASAQFVLPAFAAALNDLGLSQSLDQELSAFLDTIYAANRERNAEVRCELAEVVGVLNRAGIEPVLLKGAIRLADELYPDDGWRMLRDLDLLVPSPSLAKAVRALQTAGYAASGSEQAVLQRGGGGACQIDLHSELFDTPRQARLAPAVDVIDRARRVTLDYGIVGVPAVEHQLIHLIGHCQIRHLGHAFGRVSLRNRLEAAALVHWGHGSIDWQAVVARFVALGYRRPLLAFLLALDDGNWCPGPVRLKIDRLAALQRWRIALQARSVVFGYVGARVGWWVSELTRQIEKPDGIQRRAAKNLRRLICERGAAGRMVRVLLGRQRHLLHVLPHLSWLGAP